MDVLFSQLFAGLSLGSVAVSWAQTSLSEAFPSGWIYAQGALFILVVAFLPGGLAELFTRWRRARRGSVPDGGAPALADGGTSDGSRPGAARSGEPDTGDPTTERPTAVDHDPATTGRTA